MGTCRAVSYPTSKLEARPGGAALFLFSAPVLLQFLFIFLDKLQHLQKAIASVERRKHGRSRGAFATLAGYSQQIEDVKDQLGAILQCLIHSCAVAVIWH